MEPDEIIEKLKGLGVNVSRKTLYNWEQWGLIPKAAFRNSRRTEYPEEALAEAYASAKMRKGKYRLTKESLQEIRELALEIEGTQAELQMFFDNFLSWTREDWLVNEWLTEKAKILSGLKPEEV